MSNKENWTSEPILVQASLEEYEKAAPLFTETRPNEASLARCYVCKLRAPDSEMQIMVGVGPKCEDKAACEKRRRANLEPRPSEAKSVRTLQEIIADPPAFIAPPSECTCGENYMTRGKECPSCLAQHDQRPNEVAPRVSGVNAVGVHNAGYQFLHAPRPQEAPTHPHSGAGGGDEAGYLHPAVLAQQTPEFQAEYVSETWTLLDQAEYLLITLETADPVVENPQKASMLRGAIKALTERCAADREAQRGLFYRPVPRPDKVTPARPDDCNCDGFEPYTHNSWCEYVTKKAKSDEHVATAGSSGAASKVRSDVRSSPGRDLGDASGGRGRGGESAGSADLDVGQERTGMGDESQGSNVLSEQALDYPHPDIVVELIAKAVEQFPSAMYTNPHVLNREDLVRMIRDMTYDPRTDSAKDGSH